MYLPQKPNTIFGHAPVLSRFYQHRQDSQIIRRIVPPTLPAILFSEVACSARNVTYDVLAHEAGLVHDAATVDAEGADDPLPAVAQALLQKANTLKKECVFFS
eukprot:TRINITY_DN67733_c5_g1_i21.p1 TRINITY_DN67733_c5_g1~~TRINITY_DN67733_c5_g1_i21.p1  ORF type:complete len:103 (+),score=1.74 TRINITY_DN67733_c5_g1_i21:261-569(+)